MIPTNKTSIIILTYNNLNYNIICLDSIRKYTDANSYEIIVIDNNSTDGTREWLKEQSDIKLILNDENIGFPKGCNIGIEAAEKENDILFLNNDTKVTPRWLSNLKTCLYSNEKIGAAASITNNCSNYQSINIPYENMEELIEFADKNNVSSPKKWEEKTRLVAFCLLVKREVINLIGTFDERFSPGNFEDDDLSMRIIEANYKLMVCHDSFIHHFGSASFNADNGKFNTILKENAQKFQDKWHFNSNYESIIKFDVINSISEPIDKELNILELDCNLGATLLRLKYIHPKARLYGIETDLNVARICGKIIEITTKDFEESYNMNFKENKENFFDYIILGNKLQSSSNPWKLLKEIKKFLKPGGYIIATIPNVMHYSVIKTLLNGQFTCSQNPLVDRSYNKFFTLTDIYNIFNECGYVNPYVLQYRNESTQEDDTFLNQICNIVGENMRWHFLSYEYVAKFQRDFA
ncbi:glycosyltransferase [Clostridium sp. C2-6-12]|uniref:glycosyltransferase n=1 Tax=Clostridium sp. C2-6-12 TaxID=2698832 RepID=UPI00137083ED|nr:glycosyltransferase [Clostridium sp. C2-6-12]